MSTAVKPVRLGRGMASCAVGVYQCQLEGLLCLPIDLIMCRLGRPEAILFDEEELVVVFFLLQEQAAVKYVHNSGNVVVIGYIGRNL